MTRYQSLSIKFELSLATSESLVIQTLIHSIIYRLDSKTLATLGTFNSSWFVWAEIECTVHVNLPKPPLGALHVLSSFWLLRVVSREISQTEKKRTACKALCKFTK